MLTQCPLPPPLLPSFPQVAAIQGDTSGAWAPPTRIDMRNIVLDETAMKLFLELLAQVGGHVRGVTCGGYILGYIPGCLTRRP